MLAFFIGISANVDVLLISQMIPMILVGILGGLASEIIVTVSGHSKEINTRFVILYLFVLQLIALIVVLPYFLSVPLFADLLDVEAESIDNFKKLSLVFILNIFPAIFVSVMQPLIFLKEAYKKFIYFTLCSELSGLMVIFFAIPRWGIMAFAFGAVAVSLINAFSFLAIIKVKISDIFDWQAWREESENLKNLLKRQFLLTGNGLLGFVSTFIERSFSVKYLNGGYLSSLNYAKTLFLLPNSILLSSIITTTFMEQVKKFSEGLDVLSAYTKRMFNIILASSIVFQLILLIFAPIILILFFRRGQFKNSDVESTLIIFELLSLGFIPVVINDFFIRTLYIFSNFKILLIVSAINIISQAVLIYFLRDRIHEIVPITIIIAYYTTMFILFSRINKRLSEKISFKKFLQKLLPVLTVCGLIVVLNKFMLQYYLDKTNGELFLISLPLASVLILIVILVMKKIGLMAIFAEKIPILTKILPKYFYQNVQNTSI